MGFGVEVFFRFIGFSSSGFRKFRCKRWTCCVLA